MINLAANLDRSKLQLPDTLPDYTARDIFDIDFDQLDQSHVLLDLDLTVRRAHATKVEAEVATYLAEKIGQGAIRSLNIASNSNSDLSVFAKQLNARVFQPFNENGARIKKPNPKFFDHILSELDITADDAVMIGDKCRHDIQGANRAGIRTVMVDPLGPDYWFDVVLLTRYRDKRALKIAQSILNASSSKLE